MGPRSRACRQAALPAAGLEQALEAIARPSRRRLSVGGRPALRSRQGARKATRSLAQGILDPRSFEGGSGADRVDDGDARFRPDRSGGHPPRAEKARMTGREAMGMRAAVAILLAVEL